MSKRGGYAVIVLAAGILLCSVSVKPTKATAPGVCSGVLTKLEENFVIQEDPEHICIFSGETQKKIFAICTLGHRCEVEGLLDDCKESGECSELTHVVSARDLTLAEQQEQPPLPDAPEASPATEVEKLPEEILRNVQGIARTCKSGMDTSNDFARYIASGAYRFIALHFEKVRCENLNDICRTGGCLHQIYVAKGDKPFLLLTSQYVSEMDLKY